MATYTGNSGTLTVGGVSVRVARWEADTTDDDTDGDLPTRRVVTAATPGFALIVPPDPPPLAPPNRHDRRAALARSRRSR